MVAMAYREQGWFFQSPALANETAAEPLSRPCRSHLSSRMSPVRCLRVKLHHCQRLPPAADSTALASPVLLGCALVPGPADSAAFSGLSFAAQTGGAVSVRHGRDVGCLDCEFTQTSTLGLGAVSLPGLTAPSGSRTRRRWCYRATSLSLIGRPLSANLHRVPDRPLPTPYTPFGKSQERPKSGFFEFEGATRGDVLVGTVRQTPGGPNPH